MHVDTLISRAKSGLNKHTRYQSPGTTPPLDAVTWPPSGAKIDCSGFMAWCLRVSRKVNHPKYIQINGGWFETTAIHADVANSWGFFEQLSIPRVGAFLVYPDHDGHDGHIGVVTSVKGGSGINGVSSIIHCSLGAWNTHQDAIMETPPTPFLHQANSLIGWYTDIA